MDRSENKERINEAVEKFVDALNKYVNQVEKCLAEGKDEIQSAETMLADRVVGNLSELKEFLEEATTELGGAPEGVWQH